MATPRPVRIIAHGEKLEPAQLAEAIESITARIGGQPAIELVRSTGPGDIGDLTRAAANDGVARVVAAGGDGTLREVVEGLLSVERSHRPALGVIPLGTANDFATGLGIPSALDQALEVALTSRPRPVDSIRADGESLDVDRLVNVATAGVLSEATAKLPGGLKRALGPAAYAVAAVAASSELDAFELELIGPRFQWVGEAYALAIGNGRLAGGGFVCCPDAAIDDGLLEASVVSSSVGPGDALRIADQRSLAADVDGVVQARGPWFTVRTSRPLHFNFDGEPVRSREVTFEVDGHALRLCSPLAGREGSVSRSPGVAGRTK